jgi:hypothetical protein
LVLRCEAEKLAQRMKADERIYEGERLVQTIKARA